MGDFIKGSQLDEFPEKIRKGILLHRKIDTFTDSHPVVMQSKIRLRPKYRHYAPVIVDMYYDHFLARDWSNYSSQGLKDFTTAFYKMAWDNAALLPSRVLNLLKHMSSTDWLFHYKEIEGLSRALTGMARRTSFDSGMENATQDLVKDYDLYLEEFNQFFPELIAHCKE